MTKEEITKWFWDKFNSCYSVIDNDYKENYFLYYEPQFIRQMKLCRITGKEIKYPEKHSGDILFYLNFKNGFLECDYDKIWSYFESNYSPNYNEISELIREMLLKEHDKLSVLTPPYWQWSSPISLKEYDKLSVLTPLQTFYGYYHC